MFDNENREDLEESLFLFPQTWKDDENGDNCYLELELIGYEEGSFQLEINGIDFKDLEVAELTESIAENFANNYESKVVKDGYLILTPLKEDQNYE